VRATGSGASRLALQQLILSRSVVRKFAKGQVISVEDSVPKGLFAVLEGQVHLVREVGTGDEALMHVGEPGYWFGEFAVLTGRPTVATVLAHTPVRTLLLSKAQFDRIVADDPRHYEAFARLALDRYAILIRAFAELRDLAPEPRLRGRLAAMARVRQQDRPSAAPVSLAVSQGDLARMVGVSRQTLNALLGKLRQEGLIEVEFRRIRVLDLARLADPHDGMEPAARAGASVRGVAANEVPRARSERTG
jgi:CRP/FNR family transcriptional regulator, cyclic AMP receptor protein